LTVAEIVAGQHAVGAVLADDPGRIREVWLQRGRDTQLAQELTRRFEGPAVAVHLLARAQLDALFPGLRHQGVVVRARARAVPSFKGLLSSLDAAGDCLLVVLDAVEDPHNLGAVLRTADAAGVDALLLPRSRGVGLTPAVRKVAAGAAETVPVVAVANLSRALRELGAAGARIVGTSAQASTTLYETDLRGPLVLVLGAEGRGLRPLTERQCDILMRLPMRGTVQSLNVSVSAGICLYEALRQRGH
jgi:23S rRNA (guanosine2251-2'-O)-methyltransferase